MLLVPQNIFMHTMNFVKQVYIYVSKDVYFKLVSINLSTNERKKNVCQYTYINLIDIISCEKNDS